MPGFPSTVSTQRYAILSPLPKTLEGIQQLAELIYQRMLGREEEAVQKLQQVIDFATGDDCMLQRKVSALLIF